MRATPGRNAVLVLALLSIIWSYNWVVMKQVLQWTGPFEFAAWRGALGAVVLFVLLLVRRESLQPPPLLPLLLIGIAQTLESSLLAIGAGLCWAIGTVLSKRLFVQGRASILSLSAWQMAVGAVGLVAVAWIVDEPAVQWTAGFIGALAYNAILASGIAWVLWSYIVDKLPMTISGLSSLVIPILGVFFAWAVLGEAPSPAEWAGIGMLGAALATVAVMVKPRPGPRPG